MKSIALVFFFLLSGMVQAQLWQDNFEDALANANAEEKPIVVVFSGSDWCGPCIRFKKRILDSEDFKNYASENFVLYNADFPRKKKNQLPTDKLNANKSLAEKFNPRGFFPLVVVLDQQESLLGKTGFDTKKSPQEYISLLNGFVK
ncbi:thioredoxin family protein [Flagellimonas allohymeniacidonis]|uniref:Thioredoxin family protein n=1 Tax=Flagellimonas allohymeniacidonis TaxID=2517819 RepID=A0A4Q8QKY5_9FLAO|nr:thioredoxin family protein [Allomuricauda hymeniacidonis]TAI49473.1 thioredoxin family protein [Allomuricauda hymeniacidonis]